LITPVDHGAGYDEGGPVEALGSPNLVLLAAVALVAAACGFLASNAMHRNRRRDRAFFVLGTMTGLVAATITSRRMRRLRRVQPLIRAIRRR
jgi:hypothetical protein